MDEATQEEVLAVVLARRDAIVRRDERQIIGRLIRETVEAEVDPPNKAAAEAFLKLAEVLER